MLPNREGHFSAWPADIGVNETGPNNLATVVIHFSIFSELNNGEWLDVQPENMQISGYFYLEKRDGTLNTAAIDQLKKALGWDGADFDWFDANRDELREHPVQIKCEFEEYNGANRIKVKWLDEYGAGATGAGVTHADDATRRGMAARLGAKLRAYSGGKPVAGPKPTGRPTPPSPKPAVGPPASAPTPPKPAVDQAVEQVEQQLAESSADQAWGAFAERCGEHGIHDQQSCEREWFRVLAEMFPTKDLAQLDLTPNEWATVEREAPGRILPI